MLPLACTCARNSIVRYTKFEWAARYRKTIAKIVNYGESTKKEFLKEIISKLISVAQVTKIHHSDNLRGDIIVFDDLSLSKKKKSTRGLTNHFKFVSCTATSDADLSSSRLHSRKIVVSSHRERDH